MKVQTIINIAASTVLVGLLIFGIYSARQTFQLEEANEQLNEQLMQSDLKLGRAHTQFGNAEDYINELESAIANEISERQGIVTEFAKLKARYEILEKSKRIIETKIIKRGEIIEVPTELNLLKGGVYYAHETNALSLVHYVEGHYADHRLKLLTTMYPNTTEGIQWDFDYALSLDFEVQMVESHLPSGAINHYAEIYEIDKDGNRLEKLKLTTYEVVVQQPQDKQIFWWAPRIDFGVNLYFNASHLEFTTGGSIGFSFMGYGRTIKDLDFRFIRLSVEILGQDFGIGITPAVYNIGQHIPLINFLDLGFTYTFSPFSLNHYAGIFIGVPI